ncbi:MAG: 3'-5' exonuclease [Candidatus Gastranaerophilales bacterium]|nr:3'-5' exonuclease [Candidatus Gastranaerophilales bacterium]
MLSTSEFPENYTVIDIETTGLSPEKNSIIELSAIKVRKNKIDGMFTELVKPSGSISSFISSLTGITNEMVKNTGKIENVLPHYIDFISNDIVLGHNVKFDIRFISKNLENYYNKQFRNQSTDTMRLSRKYCPNLQNHKLSALADYFNIDSKGHHRGLKDCEMTYYVYENIKQIAENL